MENAYAEYGEAVRLLGVVTRDDPTVADDFASSVGMTYPHAVDADGALLDALGIPGLPVTPRPRSCRAHHRETGRSD